MSVSITPWQGRDSDPSTGATVRCVRSRRMKLDRRTIDKSSFYDHVCPSIACFPAATRRVTSTARSRCAVSPMEGGLASAGHFLEVGRGRGWGGRCAGHRTNHTSHGVVIETRNSNPTFRGVCQLVSSQSRGEKGTTP